MKATARRRKNFITSILVHDTEYTDQQNKEQHIWQHFNDLLGTYQPRNSSLNLEALDLPACHLASLDLAFSEEEIKKAIFDMHPEKSPGPDGYTGLFFRRCWDTVKHDLIAALRHFQGLNTQNLFLLNSAVIALLPIHQGAIGPQDFRPISLLREVNCQIVGC